MSHGEIGCLLERVPPQHSTPSPLYLPLAVKKNFSLSRTESIPHGVITPRELWRLPTLKGTRHTAQGRGNMHSKSNTHRVNSNVWLSFKGSTGTWVCVSSRVYTFLSDPLDLKPRYHGHVSRTSAVPHLSSADATWWLFFDSCLTKNHVSQKFCQHLFCFSTRNAFLLLERSKFSLRELSLPIFVENYPRTCTLVSSSNVKQTGKVRSFATTSIGK